MKPIAICLMCLALASPALALDWDTTEKVMFGSYLGLSLLDAYQSSHFPDHVTEGNPIISGLFGDHPEMWEMVLFKAGIAGVLYLLVDKALDTHKARKIALGMMATMQLGVCISNEVVSGGIAFKF